MKERKGNRGHAQPDGTGEKQSRMGPQLQDLGRGLGGPAVRPRRGKLRAREIGGPAPRPRPRPRRAAWAPRF